MQYNGIIELTEVCHQTIFISVKFLFIIKSVFCTWCKYKCKYSAILKVIVLGENSLSLHISWLHRFVIHPEHFNT